MSLEFLSGLALIIVTVCVLAYIIKEFFDIGAGELRGGLRYLAEAFEKHTPRDAKPVNAHLIGVIGKVTAHSDDVDRPMRVRLNFESWPARSSSTGSGPVPIGASVKVMEVDGPVLIVEATDDPD